MLYNNKKQPRKKFNSTPLGKDTYEDTEYIRESMADKLGEGQTLRVRLIRNEPVPAYRVSILQEYKTPRSTKYKDVRTIIQPGLYVVNQWWVDKVNPKEYLWTPPLVNL
jgi:hypothetical protein